MKFRERIAEDALRRSSSSFAIDPAHPVSSLNEKEGEESLGGNHYLGRARHLMRAATTKVILKRKVKRKKQKQELRGGRVLRSLRVHRVCVCVYFFLFSDPASLLSPFRLFCSHLCVCVCACVRVCVNRCCRSDCYVENSAHRLISFHHYPDEKANTHHCFPFYISAVAVS